jgi:hypothetical protein
MTVLFAGGESEAFTIGTGVAEDTTGGSYDSSYARCSLGTGASAGTSDTPNFASAVTTFWLHFEYHQSSNGTGQSPVQLYNSSGTVVFRLTVASAGNWKAQYWNGSAFVDIGSTFAVGSSTRYTFDLKVVCGGSGSFELYSAGSLLTSGSASMTSVTNIQKVRLMGPQSNVSGRFSQVICADVATVGWKFHLKPPTGNGANTAFTNDYTAVDETVLSDADFIFSAAAGDVETYTGAALSLGSGTVKAVVVSMRIKNDGSSPVNAQAALRRGSTNYFSSNLSGISVGFGPALGIFETDPSTSTTWLGSDAQSASTEFGVKSIA